MTVLLFLSVESQYIIIDREGEGGYHREEDEMINNIDEEEADAAPPAVFPKRMKAVLRFGYDEGFKNHIDAKGETFEEYIESVFTMFQVYWLHPSLTTEVIFEVLHCFISSSIYQYSDIKTLNELNYLLNSFAP